MTRFQDASFHDDGTTGGVVRRLNTVFKRLIERWGRDPIYYPDRTVTASFNFTDTDELVVADTSGGSVVGTLPLASTVRGRRYGIKKYNAANTVSFAASGVDTIDGGATLSWTSDKQTVVVQSVLVTAPSTYGWRAVAVYGSAGGTLTDGDKGDITVSGAGTVWTVDDEVWPSIWAIDASEMAGADWGQKVTAALALVTPTRPVIDATKLTGAQSLSGNVDINVNGVVLLLGRMRLAQGTNTITVSADSVTVRAVGGARFQNELTGSYGVDCTYTGTGTAWTVGSAGGTTYDFKLEDVGINISSGGGSAKALQLNRCIGMEVNRFYGVGAAGATSQTLLVCDGTGDFISGTISNVALTNGAVGIDLTGTGAQAANGVTVLGGTISTSATGTTKGIRFAANATGNLVLGVDIEGFARAVSFEGTASYNKVECRMEGNTLEAYVDNTGCVRNEVNAQSGTFTTTNNGTNSKLTQVATSIPPSTVIMMEGEAVEGDPGPPGPPGPAGVSGSTGAQGPMGPAVFLVGEGSEGEMGMPIPGPAGAAGSAGSTGAQGPVGPAVFFCAEPGDDGMMGPPGATGPQGPAGVGGGGGATTVEVNLGSTLKCCGRFTITDAGISGTSKVMCWQAPGPYTGKGTRADEAELQPVQIITVSAGSGSATAYWQTPPYLGLDQFPMMTQGTATQIPKDPQSIVRQTAKRIGKVRGNVKFSYTIFS